MGLVGQRERLPADAGRDLKNVAVALAVVGDHVEHVNPLDPDAGEIEPLAARVPQTERTFDEPLGQTPGAHAVGGELLAGEVDQPDVAVELAGTAEFQEHRRPQHQRGGGRVIVVGAGGGHAGELSAALRCNRRLPYRPCRSGRP